ncbi:YeeE/YedE family protein [Paenalcaligenes niemegkensis]|uniref:YeeE/YedE family protein n=1 Tax=Paenalcaligenes niemegkensis TaxID=2895469 RepID=UPI001EE84DEE|nr:YeeE/YedE family protein [Paenalcaligenes niemegkensis]MCQ9616142.1 YeeE/YedE family protein [Paenalcaligenes niemegkensis]
MPQLELVLWAGLAIGFVFGASGQLSGFCLHRGLSEFWSGRNSGYKLHAFALALAVALAGTHLVASAGLVDINRSLYLMPSFSWLLLPIGGLMFGYGMGLANGCGARALVLLGQGNLRSLLVLLCLGIAAYMTLTGLLAPLRSLGAQHTLLTPAATTLPEGLLRSLIVWALVAGLAFFALRAGPPGRRTSDLTGGAVVGLLVVAGWLTTGWLGADDFDPLPVASLSFIAPVGDTIQYAMIATGMSLRFSITLVLGVVAGSFVAAALRGRYRIEGFESAVQMSRYIAGGILMGVGGTLALGCSIGQGLAGLSTLAYSSMISALAIVAGARLAWKFGSVPGGS